MRAATVDVGTNTVLLLVAERTPGGQVRAVAERATITRLGEGVDRTRRLAPAAVGRTLACLEEYARVARELGAERVSVVGTSAMRDASGGEGFQDRVRELFGAAARVLSGDEEARLTFRGALSGLEGLSATGDGEVAVFDIGGGSTEVVVGRLDGGPRLSFAASYDIGSVRLTERHPAHDPPTRGEVEDWRRAARGPLSSVPRVAAGRMPVGVAGTMTTLAAVSLGLDVYDGARVHGHAMPVAELRRVVDELASLSLEARRAVRGMEPGRADVIVVGGLIAVALAEHWSATSVRVSDRGVRWGLAEELLDDAARP